MDQTFDRATNNSIDDFSFRLIAAGSSDHLSAINLRNLVLMNPIGLSVPDDALQSEVDRIHLGAFSNDGRLVACMILTDEGEVLQMRQVAVALELQSRGLGSRFVRYSEEVALSRGYHNIVLHARTTAVPFYLRLGYAIDGSEFEEVGIPHSRMSKRL